MNTIFKNRSIHTLIRYIFLNRESYVPILSLFNFIKIPSNSIVLNIEEIKKNIYLMQSKMQDPNHIFRTKLIVGRLLSSMSKKKLSLTFACKCDFVINGPR